MFGRQHGRNAFESVQFMTSSTQLSFKRQFCIPTRPSSRPRITSFTTRQVQPCSSTRCFSSSSCNRKDNDTFYRPRNGETVRDGMSKPASSRKTRRPGSRSWTPVGNDFIEGVSSGPAASNHRHAPSELPEWRIQKKALEGKFSEGWDPRKKLSPDALDGIRALNAQQPEVYTTEVLAKEFEVSPEVIRRILKSKWRPTEKEAVDRQQRWTRRGQSVWAAKTAMGSKPPKMWREAINEQVGRGDDEQSRRNAMRLIQHPAAQAMLKRDMARRQALMEEDPDRRHAGKPKSFAKPTDGSEPGRSAG